MNQPQKRSFTYATRDEIECDLQLLEGKLPDDLHGYVFFNSPCGTVNSGGLPIPEHVGKNKKTNKEYGSPVFNGDAMLIRFDLSNKGKIGLKTAMLKTPCYYADEATSQDTKYGKKGWGFRMLGIARTSFKFGSRNQLNTALTPFRLPGDHHSRLTANFDMGRPWEVDVQTMKLKTPIGSTSEWTDEMPLILDYPFQLFQSTAHPSFDPLTKDFYTVNFTKTLRTMFFSRRFGKRMLTHEDEIEKKMEEHIKKIDSESPADKVVEHLNQFFHNIDEHLEIKQKDSWLERIVHKVALWFNKEERKLRAFEKKIKTDTVMADQVILMHWNGSKKLNKWKVIDENTGKPIVIEQCMHQTNLTKDYIILCDASFKFALDIMVNNPFPHNELLSRLVRKLTSKPQESTTPIYIIRRKDLDPNSDIVPAKRNVIDIETVHYSANYENPSGRITLHTAHNAASCAAEWIRPYDQLFTENNKKIYTNTVGLMTCGEMDIGRIGKYVINGETGEIISNQKMHATGIVKNSDKIEAHTWAVALHTYRDVISDTTSVSHIKQVYWQCYGLDYRYLTKFIENLYRAYPNRIIPVAEISKMNRKKIPYCLLRQNTESMKMEDYYLFKMNQNLRSLQFVPRQNKTEGLDPEMDGYIFCTMVNGEEDFSIDEYSREVWIFDASSLSAGPLCRLSHPNMNFSFTIHSAWIPDCVSQESPFTINIEQDYEHVINSFFKEDNKKFMRKFMRANVYPHFN